jgi:hypothetical protein
VPQKKRPPAGGKGSAVPKVREQEYRSFNKKLRDRKPIVAEVQPGRSDFSRAPKLDWCSVRRVPVLKSDCFATRPTPRSFATWRDLWAPANGIHTTGPEVVQHRHEVAQAAARPRLDRQVAERSQLGIRTSLRNEANWGFGRSCGTEPIWAE